MNEVSLQTFQIQLVIGGALLLIVFLLMYIAFWKDDLKKRRNKSES